MTTGDLKQSVAARTESFMNSVFTTDIYIRRPNVPVFVATCLMALAGSMLFGMYFAKQEAWGVHQRERQELVTNFAVIMKDKDDQIEGLTGILIVNQKEQGAKLAKISDTTVQIAMFLASSELSSKIDKARLNQLDAAVKHLQEVADVPVSQQVTVQPPQVPLVPSGASQ